MHTESMTVIDAPAGLEGVVVTETAVGAVNGVEGHYHYRGHDAADLARRLPVEAAWFLLQEGHLPDGAELRAFRERTAPLRALPADVAEVLPVLAGRGTGLLDDLRTALSLTGGALGLHSWLDDPGSVGPATERLVAVTGTLVAALSRLREGAAPLEPDPSLPLAADYLRMVRGETPSDEAVRAMDAYLVSTADHGLNASTFVARVVTSTAADPGAAVVGAFTAFSGPLHGGAPALALAMLQEIGTPDRAEAWIQDALGSGRRIMGFGHRVYRTEDPRALLLREVAVGFGGPLTELALEVERVALSALAEHRPGRPLRTNVEFWAAVVLSAAGLGPELFTPTFAVSRVIGWSAHIREQAAANRLYRPSSRYRPL
jgi:citrate synthase